MTLESEAPENPNMKKIKQSISVPFIWEEKPGTPKKDWRPNTPPLMNIPPIVSPPPIKLVASIPFKWEEKPGIPLPCLTQADIISPLSPPRDSEDDDDDNNDNSSGDGGIDDFGNDEQDRMWESELEPGDFESFDSFSSAQSLLANGLVSSFAISRAVPVEAAFLTNDISDGGQLQSPGTPGSEGGSSTSSYATGTTSLAGSSFLEWLFPSLTSTTANAKFPGKVGSQEKSDIIDQNPGKLQQSEDLDGESNCSVVVRRASTLGELIMMSRRRSYHRKALRLMQSNPSMDFTKRNAYGCGIFGGSNGGIGQLNQKWKKQFQLKIMYELRLNDALVVERTSQ